MTCRECECKKEIFLSADFLKDDIKVKAYKCTGVPEPFIIENIDAECTEYHEKRRKSYPVTIYEDDDWIIQKVENEKYGPVLIISSFSECHFVEDIRISQKLMNSYTIDKIKELILKEETR